MSTKQAEIYKSQAKSYKTVPAFVTKVDAELGIVDAIVSVMGIVDMGGDVIHNGAYVKTITERANKIRVLDNHNTDSVLRAVATPLEMREMSRDELPAELLAAYPDATVGLFTRAQYLLDTPEGLGVFKRIKANAINEYSIGYDALDFDYSKRIGPDGKTQYIRNLRTIRLWEWSNVLWGMNQATATVGAKSPNGGVWEMADPEHDEQKEMTADGPIRRFADYVMGGMRQNCDSCVNRLYTMGYLSEEERKNCAAALDSAMTVFKAALPESLAAQPMTAGGFYYYDSLSPDGEQKAGRVLSAANISQIESVIESLQALLASAGVGDESDDAGKSDIAKTDVKSPDQAGPIENEQSPTNETIEADLQLLQVQIELLGV